MSISSDQAILLYADSARNGDMRYFSGLHVPDPFIALRIGGRKIGVFNALEFGRARKEAALDEVLALEPLREEARGNPKFQVASVSRLLGEAIRRIHNSDSISSLFV